MDMFDKYMQVMYDRDLNAKKVEELEAKLAELEKPDPDYTQHSVPEGWKLVPIEPLLNMMSDKDHDTRITAERQLLSILAVAPGKEE
ncbi:hypothetical protein JHP_0062 [Pseudomonas phage JHP]|uniref:Uncharacterized protein n=1 Tax=Pseudomonas phage ITTPL TaxID=2544984 RepID=A0A5B7LVV2_9CAUD|nr:hypothetical protein QE324_gp139 [Pseudomonas phage ITTPL]QBJ04693.1 hypothetical protein JHP_0062 [Pseudomonas phage JHP]QBP28154.1 hypothetical protein IttPL_0140 [Pseudomonas phage ITTPL]